MCVCACLTVCVCAFVHVCCVGSGVARIHYQWSAFIADWSLFNRRLVEAGDSQGPAVDLLPTKAACCWAVEGTPVWGGGWERRGGWGLAESHQLVPYTQQWCYNRDPTAHLDLR